jgi:hypothetical protein
MTSGDWEVLGLSQRRRVGRLFRCRGFVRDSRRTVRAALLLLQLARSARLFFLAFGLSVIALQEISDVVPAQVGTCSGHFTPLMRVPGGNRRLGAALRHKTCYADLQVPVQTEPPPVELRSKSDRVSCDHVTGLRLVGSRDALPLTAEDKPRTGGGGLVPGACAGRMIKVRRAAGPARRIRRM